jgi:hypothetical protein
MPHFLTFIIFNIHSLIIHQFDEALLLVSSSILLSAREASTGCRAESQTRACLTASRRNTNWVTPHPHLIAWPGRVSPLYFLHFFLIIFLYSVPDCESGGCVQWTCTSACASPDTRASTARTTSMSARLSPAPMEPPARYAKLSQILIILFAGEIVYRVCGI